MQITLKNEFLTVVIDTRGAELQSVTSADGIEYLWDGHAPYWNRRSPVLFPTIGALRDGFAVSDGGDIRLPKHGFCRSAPFVLIQADETSATYEYTDTPETREAYPYAFRFCIHYALEQNRLQVTYTVANTGEKPMPFCVGGHPAFRVPLVEGEAYTDYIVEFDEPETADCPTVNLSNSLVNDLVCNRLLTEQTSFRLHHVLFRGDALIFDDLKSSGVKLYSEKSGRGVRMDFADFPIFAVWSMPDDQPFVCFEPWQGGATRESEDDVFEHKKGVVINAPGETYTASYMLTMF
ncbi:MAG: aldose 1-epimerase family protein [Clostridia bacterium]|nr:aldose 1-epimerase family protein [Clostridia bacterium]